MVKLAYGCPFSNKIWTKTKSMIYSLFRRWKTLSPLLLIYLFSFYLGQYWIFSSSLNFMLYLPHKLLLCHCNLFYPFPSHKNMRIFMLKMAFWMSNSIVFILGLLMLYLPLLCKMEPTYGNYSLDRSLYINFIYL